VGLSLVVFGGPGWAAEPSEEAPHSHDAALTVATDDPVLQEQILKIHQTLGVLHEQMTQRRRALQYTPDQMRQATLYAELDGLRREHDMLERLLHDLVEEAKATEWTTVDEALKRARSVERSQERAYQREEALRER